VRYHPGTSLAVKLPLTPATEKQIPNQQSNEIQRIFSTLSFNKKIPREGQRLGKIPAYGRYPPLCASASSTSSARGNYPVLIQGIFSSEDRIINT
jgi:hypothetical protein